MAKTVLVEVREKDKEVCMSKEKFEDLIAEFESLVETIEILSDPEMVEQIKQGEKDIQEGRVFEFKKKGDILKRIRG